MTCDDDAVIRVVGIDPGLQRTGYACVEVPRDGWDAVLVEAGVLRLKAGASLSYRLRQLEVDLLEVLEELAPSVVAVESVLGDFCRARLTHVKAPTRVVFLDELPLTGSG